jgi:DNA-binding transcriptional MerR regulator
MKTQLHIGEVAKLLGITPKTIRHYHKVGLLTEPQRTESGYRLYTAGDLLRLQRIRRLQTLGLSLKQIKTLLGEHVSGQERSLREVLQSLLEDLSAEIRSLAKQHERIETLLREDNIDILAPSSNTSPTLEFVKEHFGEQMAGASEELLKLDAKIFSQLDAFNWPESYNEVLQLMVQYVAERPPLYHQMLGLAERIAALASLPEDAPEVDQLIEETLTSDELLALLAMQSELSTRIPQLASPFADVLSELANDTLSPAQQRFLEALNRIQSDNSKREEQ